MPHREVCSAFATAIQEGDMRVPQWMQWIWFIGAAVWLIDGLIGVHYNNWLHARIALSVAVVFFAAGLFYRVQKR